MPRFAAAFLLVSLIAALAPGAGAQIGAPSLPPARAKAGAAEVAAMAKRLTDKSSAVRGQAARFFIENDGDFTSATPALLALLKIPLTDNPESSLDGDGWEARTYALTALGRIGKTDAGVRNALLAMLPPGSRKPFEAKYETSFGENYGIFEALAEASTDNPDLIPTLLAYIQESIAQKTQSLQTLRAENMSAPEAARAEMIAAVKRRQAGKTLSPEARKAAEAASKKRLQAARQIALQAAQERKRDEFGEWRAKKLATLMYVQRDNAPTFATLTRQFDGEAPKVRQAALFTLVWQNNWTVAHAWGASGIMSFKKPPTTLAIDWMRITLLKDTDPKIREYASHGIAYTQPPDPRAIAALLPLLGDTNTDVRTAAVRDLVQAVKMRSHIAALAVAPAPSLLPFYYPDQKPPTPEEIAAALADAETVVARIKARPAADRARLTEPEYANLLREATEARDQLAAVVKRQGGTGSTLPEAKR